MGSPVADEGGGDDCVLQEADEATVEPVGGSCCGSWLADNAKEVTYALARMPALYMMTWFFLLVIVGPTYFPNTVRTIITCYFGYALPRFFVILGAGFIAMIKCIQRNNATDSTTWIHKAAGSEIAFTDVTHVIVCCIYTEPIEKIAETLDTLSAQMEVSKQMIVCMVRRAPTRRSLLPPPWARLRASEGAAVVTCTLLAAHQATEARDKNGIRTAKELRRRYGAKFGGFYITQHMIKDGEVAGKSSNENWAGASAAAAAGGGEGALGSATGRQSRKRASRAARCGSKSGHGRGRDGSLCSSLARHERQRCRLPAAARRSLRGWWLACGLHSALHEAAAGGRAEVRRQPHRHHLLRCRHLLPPAGALFDPGGGTVSNSIALSHPRCGHLLFFLPTLPPGTNDTVRIWTWAAAPQKPPNRSGLSRRPGCHRSTSRSSRSSSARTPPDTSRSGRSAAPKRAAGKGAARRGREGGSDGAG